jgi:mRNA interferase HigB
MRVIAIRTLREFWQRHADAEEPLRAWYSDARRATWQAPADIKSLHAQASVIAGNRIVFNIKGNDYRLVIHINYPAGVVYIRFIGTHAQYDRIDAKTI